MKTMVDLETLCFTETRSRIKTKIRKSLRFQKDLKDCVENCSMCSNFMKLLHVEQFSGNLRNKIESYIPAHVECTLGPAERLVLRSKTGTLKSASDCGGIQSTPLLDFISQS